MISPANQEQTAVLSLIQDIKDGRVDPGTIAKDLRQACVEVFMGEGYSVPAMAQILKRSDKTIRRDIDEIRERNALSPDVNLAKKIIGEMVMDLRIHHSYLMRLARTPGASVSEKGQCEYLAALILMQFVSKMQSLGYLPTQPTKVVGDFSHHVTDDSKSYPELKNMVQEMETIAQDTGAMSTELNQEIKKLLLQINKAELEEKVISLSNRKLDQQTKGTDDEENR